MQSATSNAAQRQGERTEPSLKDYSTRNKPGVSPNFFVVGAAKSGTTSLYHYLRSHPLIYLSPIKEPNHFAKDIDTTAYLALRRQRPVDTRKFIDGCTTQVAHCGHVTRRDEYMELFRGV